MFGGLKSIRTRILVCFVVFGASLTLLVCITSRLAFGLVGSVFIFCLLAMLAVVVAWHIATYLTHDIRQLAQRVQDVDPTDTRTLLQLKKPFPARTIETAELSEALRRFGGRVEGLNTRFSTALDRSRQEVSEASSTLSDFMYYIAHTLRTPLNAIRWSVESLKNEDVGRITVAQRELLDSLEHSTIKLVGVATELQDALIVLRGEALHMRPSTVDALAIVDETAGQLAVMARQKHVTLDWRRPEQPCRVRGDASRLRQVFSVVLDNAVRYTKGPNHTISIRLLLVDGSESLAQRRLWRVPNTLEHVAVFQIKDEGIGIPSTERLRVFHPFFRGASARALWVDGKGIGLTIAHAAAKGMGGDMWFTSTKGRGTTMYIAVPLLS